MAVRRLADRVAQALIDTRGKAELRPGARPLVPPCTGVLKSGCLHCPLAAFHEDFPDFEAVYQRDAIKIRAAAKEGHLIQSRNVVEDQTEVDILCVGEAPGQDEDRQGLPFVGRSGKLLREAIDMCAEQAQVGELRIGFANVVNCRPPMNRSPAKTEVQSCSHQLIQQIVDRKPKVILALGNTPLEFLTDTSGISHLNGQPLKGSHPELEGIPVVACLHPAYVLRFDHEMTRFTNAITVALGLFAGEDLSKPGFGTYITIDTMSVVKETFEKFKTWGRPVSVDTETGSLQIYQDKFPKLVCFSFSNGDNTAYVVPFDHSESPWCVGGPLEHERAELIELLRDLFQAEIDWIGQNEKFDRQHIREAIGIELPIFKTDTMTTHLVINEQRGTHGLDKLAYQYTGMGGYDRPLEDYKAAHPEADPKKGGSYANIPGSILFTYAAMDADVTWRVAPLLFQEPEYRDNPRLRILAEQFFPHLSAALADMETAGAKIDPEAVDRIDKRLTEEIERLDKAIQEDASVKQYVDEKMQREAEKDVATGKRRRKPFAFEFNPNSGKQVGEIFFGLLGYPPGELTETGSKNLRYRLRQRQDECRANGTRFPKMDDMRREAIEAQEWSYFTTDAETMHSFERDHDSELATLILSSREAIKLQGTFINALKTMCDKFGLLHSSFWISGTATGRLSSSDPNLQNISNNPRWNIKTCYVSRFGDDGILLNCDFSQIELRIAACLFDEPKMKQVYLERGDLHTLTASIVSGVPVEEFAKLDKDTKKKMRTSAKRTNFGCVPLDTEALTRDGWRGYGQIKVGDEVLGMENGVTKWVPVTGIVYHPVAKVVTLATKNFSMETTEDHRWMAEKRVVVAGKRKMVPCIVSTADIKHEHRIFLSAPIQSTCLLPISVYEAALVAWLFTDGHFFFSELTGAASQGRDGWRQKHFGGVYQSKPAGVAALKELFSHFPHTLHVRPVTDIHEFRLRSGYTHDLWKRAELHSITLEEFVLRLGTAELRAFVEAAFQAEGHLDHKGTRIVTQNRGPTADALKLAIFLAGYFPREVESDTYKDNVSLKLRYGKPVVTGQRLKKTGERETAVWCLQTATSNWVMRHRNQIMVTGNSLYGSEAPGIRSALKKDGIFVSLEDCEKFLENFFKGFPRLRAGMDELERKVTKLGYLDSFTGHRRRVPEVGSSDPSLVSRAVRQSINFPIQSGAAIMTLMALVLITRALKNGGFKSKLILTVHDSIMFDCVLDEYLAVAILAKDIMENLPALSDEVLPGLDWNWIDIPIIAEVEAGLNWGQMQEFEPADLQDGKTSDQPLIGLNEKGKMDILRKPVNEDELGQCLVFKMKKK